MRSIAILAALGSLAPLVSGHCKITGATGDQGGSAAALGIQSGSGNSEKDVTIFNGGSAGFGRTPGAGQVNAAKDLQQALQVAGSSQLPQVSAGGTLNMVLHQVNGDGAGPMSCSISTDATGGNWQTIQVAQQVPGKNGLSGANNKDFQLSAKMPQNLACSGQVGGQSNVCMVKCQNPVGPFGGVVPVQTAGGAGSGGSGSGTQTGGNSQASGAAQGQKAGGKKGGKKDAAAAAAGQGDAGDSQQGQQAQGAAQQASQQTQNGQGDKKKHGQQAAQGQQQKRADDIDCEMEHETAPGWSADSAASASQQQRKRDATSSSSSSSPAASKASSGSYEDIDCEMEHETAPGWQPERRALLLKKRAVAGRPVAVRVFLRRRGEEEDSARRGVIDEVLEKAKRSFASLF